MHQMQKIWSKNGNGQVLTNLPFRFWFPDVNLFLPCFGKAKSPPAYFTLPKRKMNTFAINPH
jgi:hypothetical protein